MTDIERQLGVKLRAKIEFEVPQTSGAPIWPRDELGFGIPMKHSITSAGAFLAIQFSQYSYWMVIEGALLFQWQSIAHQLQPQSD